MWKGAFIHVVKTQSATNRGKYTNSVYSHQLERHQDMSDQTEASTVTQYTPTSWNVTRHV